ncbi:MAG: endonuclease III [Pseudomonadales bacterium]|nr:endonuclease III [Pseudomonadales bacterium]MDP7359737.1 endonuclease III [Pseudomonadales bacterium]MDP7598053.1 endonuclease III [Pseudomonadales bacterium]HJN49107.1 endonuclease III [Pseudomonadales bacterium]
MNRQKRLDILVRLRDANPNPSTELTHDSPFELLICVILSAQATDISVNKASTKLFAVANTPTGILTLGEEKLKTFIRTIGLYNGKASNIIKTCRLLIDRHDSEVPATRPELEALPGVGRKTANVILNTAFGQHTMGVDTHIFRIANRINFAPGRNVLEVEKNLLKVIPDEFMRHAHHWLILHGRYVCTARTPNCSSCGIVDLCEYKAKVL